MPVGTCIDVSTEGDVDSEKALVGTHLDTWHSSHCILLILQPLESFLSTS